MKARFCETFDDVVEFELGGKTYELAMTLDVMAQIQRMKGDLGDALVEAIDKLDSMIEIFVLIFNSAIANHNDDHPEDKWPRFDADTLSRRLKQSDLQRLTEALFAMMGRALPEPSAKGADVTDELLQALDAENLPEDDGKNGPTGDAR